jgi:hypothetical protein
MGEESERGQEVAAVEVYLSAYCEIHSYKVSPQSADIVQKII